ENLPAGRQGWKIKTIKFPYLWTQIGLSLEMLFHPVDVLFIPSHVVPFIRSKNTIVTIHGLEFEFCLKAYSWWERLYMRWSIKNSCRWAKKIIAVSENTKRDLMKLYKVPEEKISVIYEGYENNFLNPPLPLGEDARRAGEGMPEDSPSLPASLSQGERGQEKYLLFIGRLEERKNILGIIKAFEILKERYKIPHKLILAGRPGFNYEKIQSYVSNSSNKSDIILSGFISEAEKWQLLSGAGIFLFPTLYEGFGIPILEAQSVGVPVVVGNNSSILEVVSSSAILVNPKNPSTIAEAAYKLISNQNLREDMIKRGYENVKRFSWEKCAEEVCKLIMN
ncbi:MAG: glycosyltransferase family 1 protein, partial [Candidatus Moranbacteria bacterium]|nr:glycosyltransferase family 1 protein [Candidatus Moranbacteria bacterium]